MERMHIIIKLDRKERNAFKAKCAAIGEPMQDVLRELILEYINKK